LYQCLCAKADGQANNSRAGQQRLNADVEELQNLEQRDKEDHHRADAVNHTHKRAQLLSAKMACQVLVFGEVNDLRRDEPQQTDQNDGSNQNDDQFRKTAADEVDRVLVPTLKELSPL